MYKIILIITLILLALGFVPYKFPHNPDKLANNELLVDHEESTCTTDLSVVKGKLTIPKNLKTYFSKDPTDFSIDEAGESMFDPINNNQSNLWLISENQFIISGRVTSVDSSDLKYCGAYYPKFKIDDWSPTKYHANVWTFSIPMFFTYFISLFVCILVSIYFLFFRRIK